MNTKRITLKTADAMLAFDGNSGQLVSFRSAAAPDQEFIAAAPDHPVFVIQYLDHGQYRRLTSRDARQHRVLCVERDRSRVLVMTFSRLAGLDLTVTATIRASPREPLCRWSIGLRNEAGLAIVDVQFPFVVVRYGLRGTLLTPHYAGRLISNPAPETLGPDAASAWQFIPENGDSTHYPGGLFAQFLAYYNDRAGLYLACEDTAANVKLIKPLHREPGIRLGIAHVGDWPRRGERTLEYDVVLRSFTGDWYAAAEIYRAWSMQQRWFVPLHRRTDAPRWLLDSPAYITLRLQGELDLGPVFPVKPFLPYSKAIPLLDRLARRIAAPLVAVLMSWERGGPWVYPDCFPPVGGDAALKRFVALARRRGWRVGSFCNGTRWVLGHFWNDYDGTAYYRKHGGAASVCRTPDGNAWQETWDRTWRPSHAGCLGAPLTRRIAEDFVRRLLAWGMQSIQFFDQNMGAATFPCFAQDHEHPALPGKWMAAKMREVMEAFQRAAATTGARDVIHSTEGPCNETCLPLFHECDVRVIPPGHVSNYDFLPLYHYLYHECIVLQGGMGMGPEPHHLPTRNACNAVLGELPGAVLTGDGTLLNKDTGNWAPWEPRVGSDAAAVEVLRTVLALRRGPARDFLTLGRMLRPAGVDNIDTVVWESKGRMNRIPAVFHAAWQAPDGRPGIVLANWTATPRAVRIADERLGRRATLNRSGRALTQRRLSLRRAGAGIDLVIPALGCALLASETPQ